MNIGTQYKPDDKYKSDANFIFFKNLDRDTFLSMYTKAEFIIGSSSSGMLESASIPLPAINVGVRQCGRVAPYNVVFSDTDRESIDASIDITRLAEFKDMISDIKNPYGDGNSAVKAYNLITNNDYKQLLFKNEDAMGVNNE